MSRIAFGWGPLDPWLHSDDVTEVLVNAGGEVWVERLGSPGLGEHPVGRLDRGAIDAVIERILAPSGRRLDRTSPIVDTRLPDGSRVCAVLSPIAVDGTCLAIRRFPRRFVGLDAFAAREVGHLLLDAVRHRCNVLVSGGTSSGKTTLLNCLATMTERHERIITLEDTAELRISTPHVLRLETRPGTSDGLPPVSMADLLRTALRLRPDRIVVGEIRGSEAVELVQAMNTGHDGSLATLHANSPIEALVRLESLVVREQPSWPLTDVRAQIARSVDLVVHLGRDRTGRRRVAEIAEVGATTAGDGWSVVPIVRGDERLAPLTRTRR